MKLSLAELEKIEDCHYSHEHSCNANRIPEDFRIVHCIDIDGMPQNTWHFLQLKFANNKDVYDGEAEEIGQIMNNSLVVINFCPFCGQKLEIVKSK